jgi:hypothetical protein
LITLACFAAQRFMRRRRAVSVSRERSASQESDHES